MPFQLSLRTRALLLAFFPICLMLAATFFTIHATVRAKIEDSLKESMLRTEKALDVANADYNRRSNQLLAILSEDSGLKAGINLLREQPYGRAPDPQVLKMVQDQIRQVAGALDYDLLLLADSGGTPVTGFLGREKAPIDLRSLKLDTPPLLRIDNTIYVSTTLPINLGPENIGSLILGRKLDLGNINSSGYAALVRNHRVLLTNFSNPLSERLEQEISDKCGDALDECDVSLGASDYLAIRIQKARLGPDVRLFTFQSIDAAVDEFTHGFQRDFVLIGLGGMLVVLAFATFGSRSFSQPLTELVRHLNESEQSGRLRPDFGIMSPVIEVNRLGEAFNRAAEAIEESQERLERATLEFVETMAQALDARDPYTAGHSNRVSVNSTNIAEAMGLPDDEIEIVRIGAKLHDIGKIGIPDAVLQKPGKLTNEEYALIKMHPQIGKRILEKAGRFQQYLPIVELHHEDWNGGGYPYGLKGEELPLGVRIVHIADVYDAITSHRAYRKAMSEQQVLDILLKGSGTMFDPVVLEAFLTILRERKVLQMVLEEVSGATVHS
jgi:HD-GYP domain-containing protein (c-di-GMP phosphodiesterase class II)